MRTCPYCAEAVPDQTTVCPYCQEQIATQAVAGPPPQPARLHVVEPTQPNYEFTAAQNEVIAGLVSAMRFVGVFLIVLAALSLMVAIWSMFRSPFDGIFKLFDCILNMVLGFLLLSSASAFRKIVDT
jgi:predicted amidophosphoribosyltransferase